MVVAIPNILEEAPVRLDDQTLIDIITTDARNLTNALTELDKYRDYYESEQPLNFATEEFIETVGDDFSDLRSNWMEVVVEAMEERLDIQRIRIRDEEGNVDEELSNEVWRILLLNELEQLENDTYNGALVEGRSYIIVWPDEELGARVDYQPAQNMWVTYHPQDSKVIDRAIKRWVTPDGGQRLTLYTRDFLYKYKIEPQGRNTNPDDVQPRDTGWIPLDTAETGDPAWPLPNPFGEVPIVEFWNRGRKSELKNLIPLQDALNMSLREVLVANEFQAQRLVYIISSNKEPDGGWLASPGNVWHIQPEVDWEGNVIPTQVGSIEPSESTSILATVETFLQHIAAISRTPSYYFYLSSKQGGRGDAPSGEALRVTETGLLKKVQKVQSLWDLRWLRVARLITMALSQSSEAPRSLLGETVWTHPMSHFLAILLEEARMMIEDLGLPPVVAWRHVGLTEEQIEEALNSDMVRLVPVAAEGDVVSAQRGAAGTPSAPGPPSGTSTPQTQQN